MFAAPVSWRTYQPPRVRAVCEKWGLPYNTGPFLQQLGMVQRTILRLAFPGGKPRPKPGPYQGPLVRGSGEGDPRSNGHRTPVGAGVGS